MGVSKTLYPIEYKGVVALSEATELIHEWDPG